MIRKREYAIDFLKFFAAVLITNSHLELVDPSYKLATGGAIGDTLFLFCSGYTLFLGRLKSFDNWYKRRLSRIFPPVICWGIMTSFIFNSDQTLRSVIIYGGGWFVQCILLYYIFAFPIRKYASDHLTKIFISVLIITCIVFCFIEKDKTFSLYGWNYYKWLVFFLFFLLGAKLGITEQKSAKLSFTIAFGGLFAFTILWFGILYVQNYYQLNPIYQLLSICPLLGITYFFFLWLKSEPMNRIFHKKYIHSIIRLIGGLCYEIYLVQCTLFGSVTFDMRYPYNIFTFLITVILSAYILHLFTNFCLQTVRNSEYNWREMLKI